MEQANYIRNSKVRGGVYNENVDNIIFPKNHGPSMLCKDVKVDTNGKIIAEVCLITIPERGFNAPIERNFASHIKAPDFNYDLKDLYEANKWTSQEIALPE